MSTSAKTKLDNILVQLNTIISDVSDVENVKVGRLLNRDSLASVMKTPSGEMKAVEIYRVSFSEDQQGAGGGADIHYFYGIAIVMYWGVKQLGGNNTFDSLNDLGLDVIDELNVNQTLNGTCLQFQELPEMGSIQEVYFGTVGVWKVEIGLIVEAREIVTENIS